jgi:hypothetical protein
MSSLPSKTCRFYFRLLDDAQYDRLCEAMTRKPSSDKKDDGMTYQWTLNLVVVGIALGVTLIAGCTAQQPVSSTGYEAAAQQTASAASRAEQAASRAEAAAAKTDAVAQRAEQAAQRVEAAALKLEERFTKRMRK